MGSTKTAKAPDYTAAALAQGQSDKEVAQQLTQANRPTQIDPYSTTTWSQSSTPDQTAALTEAQTAYDQYKAAIAANPQWDSAQAQKELSNFQSKIDSAKSNQQWTQQTTYTPEQQALLEQQQGIQSTQNTRIAELLKNFQTPSLNTYGLGQVSLKSTPDLQQVGLQSSPDLQQVGLKAGPELQQVGLKDTQSADALGDLLYQQATARYSDRFTQDEAAQRAQLANQGFQLGSEGYQNTLTDFNRNKNEAYQDAATAAAIGGYQQYNTDRAANLAEYQTVNGTNLNAYNSQQQNNLANYMGQNSTQLNAFTGQRQANLADYTGQNSAMLNSYLGQRGANTSDYAAQNNAMLNAYNSQSSNDLNAYNSQMSQLSQLLGGVQGPQAVSYAAYNPATTYQSPDLLGATQATAQANQSSANASNAQKGQNTATVGTVAAAAAVAF